MSLLAHLRALIEEWRYDGIPQGYTDRQAPRAATQVDRLGSRQILWCDLNLPKFQKFREQAESARGKPQ